MFGCGKWKRDDVWTGLILVAHPASDRVVVVLEVGVRSVVRDFRTGLHVSACTAYQQEIISNVLHDGFAPIPLPHTIDNFQPHSTSSADEMKGGPGDRTHIQRRAIPSRSSGSVSRYGTTPDRRDVCL